MIDAETKLVAVIGDPVGHSLGPAMHNVAFHHSALNFVYLAFNVKNPKPATEAMRALGFKGFSVTIPHKEKIMQYLDRVDETAKKIGAVNTVVSKDGLLVGYNTDSEAAINALKEKVSLRGKQIALVGAGGASRAIAFGLQQEKVNLTIFNRTFERGKALAKAVGCEYSQFEKLNDFKPEILINATSIGMSPKANASPVEKAALKSKPLVFDVVYNPIETVLLKQAASLGCETISGVEMFVGQGAVQFELWTGKPAPKDVMRNVVIEELQK